MGLHHLVLLNTCHPIGCLLFIGHFSQKSHIITGSFAKNDLQLKASCASSPPCTSKHASQSPVKAYLAKTMKDLK